LVPTKRRSGRLQKKDKEGETRGTQPPVYRARKEKMETTGIEGTTGIRVWGGE